MADNPWNQLAKSGTIRNKSSIEESGLRKAQNFIDKGVQNAESKRVSYKDADNKVLGFLDNIGADVATNILGGARMLITNPMEMAESLKNAPQAFVDGVKNLPETMYQYPVTTAATVTPVIGGAKGVTNVMNKGNIVKGGVKAPSTQVTNATGLNIKTNPNYPRVVEPKPTPKVKYTEITPEQAVSELNPKPQYTVHDYINPKTSKTDWTMADDVISQATEPKNMLTQELKHGTAVPFKGNVSSSKVGTGTDSGWLEHGGYHTIDDTYAQGYARGIPVSSRLKNIESLPQEIRGKIADELYPYNKHVKIPDDRFKKLQSMIDSKINEYDSLLKTEGYTPEEYSRYKLHYDSWKSVKDNLKQEADVSNLRPRVITSKVPADQYLMFRDLPLREQSQDIINLATQLYTDQGYSQSQILEKLNRSGVSLYDDLTRHLGSKSKASQVLDALAAKGATDLGGAETVIFNDRNVNSFKSRPIEPNWIIEEAPSNFSADLDNIIDNHFKGLLGGGI